ncbi:MAG TPA: peptidylprolyl isomerase, partial [Candidatus Mcinerneyibacteriales bacterium]|nr:peptidylprolyl isomerase [Candidatus Mcinerneyibacteriales bacterium]
TEKGTVTIRCFGSQAPQTVENIVTLVKKGFYDGIPFHRVALNHVIQAGDPHGDGWGGSLPLIKSEISRLSYDEPGMVGIADRGKDTGSSQFFITLTPRYHLNSRYTIFARVIDGMDVVGKIEPGDLILSARVLNNMR